MNRAGKVTHIVKNPRSNNKPRVGFVLSHQRAPIRGRRPDRWASGAVNEEKFEVGGIPNNPPNEEEAVRILGWGGAWLRIPILQLV